MSDTRSDKKTGKVLKGLNGLYTVKVDEGLFQCRSATKIRKNKLKINAGDNVVFSDNGDGTGFITGVLDRKNSFIRPAVSNVDILLIVVSAGQPDPVIYNIDKLTALAVYFGVEVYIVVTKSDIVEPGFLLEIYRKTPFSITKTSIDDNNSVQEIKDKLRGKITVFTGASGVGKSTLINRLYPQINAQVGDLSEKIKRGRNTTRVTELFFMEEQTYIADTPGFSMLDFDNCYDIDFTDVISCFPDLLPFTKDCKFKKCTHTKEQGCAVISAVEDRKISKNRHQSYVRLYEELKNKPQY